MPWVYCAMPNLALMGEVYTRQKQRQILKHIVVLLLRRLKKDFSATTYVQHFMPSSNPIASHVSIA